MSRVMINYELRVELWVIMSSE